MTDDDAEWWALSAAIAWITARRPLRREHWPENMVPPRLGPSGYLSDSVRLPEAIKRLLAAQDDGVDAAMEALGALLKNAAAAGRVRLRGKGPWAPEPVEPCVMGRSRVKDAKATFIAAEEFTRDRIAFFVETESIGPGEDPYDAADELDYQPRDSRAFPRWEDVQVAAAGLRAVWPDPVEPDTTSDDALNENPLAEDQWRAPEHPRQREADEWMRRFAEQFVRTHGRPPPRDKVAVHAANQSRPGGPGFPKNVARRSYKRLPHGLRALARNPKRSTPR